MDYEEVKNQLGSISESFCPLRWTYMQVDLEHGKIKACCKTPFQKIADEQINQIGEKAIFNGAYFRERRREMMEGIKNEDCSSCWTEEELGLLSYRYLLSGKEPFKSSIAAIQSNPLSSNYVPKHIEIINNTNCDLKCCYCGPEFSSSWRLEIKRNGVLPIFNQDLQLSQSTELFKKTFWEWFGNVKESIEYVQFNGGEPLLQKEFYDFLNQLLESESNLKVGIITNLNTPEVRLKQLQTLLPLLLEKHEFRFGISQDSVGSRAEYIRRGLNWSRFDANLRALLRDFPQLEVQIAPTMSVLNVSSIKKLLVYLDELSNEYSANIVLRPSIVISPDFQSPLILPSTFSRYLEEAIDFLEKKGRWSNMRDRLYEILTAIQKMENTDRLRRNFFSWFREIDRRHKKSFPDTFPEMKDFWKLCASL